MTTSFNKYLTHCINLIKVWLLCFFTLFAFSCKKSTIAAKPVDDTTSTGTVTPPPSVVFARPSYNPSALDTTKLFNPVPVVNDLTRTDLLEISGVAASRINPGVLYIHNDSGNPNQVYLTNGSG